MELLFRWEFNTLTESCTNSNCRTAGIKMVSCHPKMADSVCLLGSLDYEEALSTMNGFDILAVSC